MLDVSRVLSGPYCTGVPAGPLNDVQTMMADPQVTHRGVLPEIQAAAGQRAAVTPIMLSTRGYPSELPAVPSLDEHRAEIMRYANGGEPPLA